MKATCYIKNVYDNHMYFVTLDLNKNKPKLFFFITCLNQM